MLGQVVPFRKVAGDVLQGVAGFDASHPWHDHIVGGAADGADPNQFDPTQLAEGVEDELKEHTDDPNVAAEIAMDHLIKDPDYYKKMKLLEDEAEAKVAAARQAGVLLARQFYKEAGLLTSVGQVAAKAGGQLKQMVGLGALKPRANWRVPAPGTVVRAAPKTMLAKATPTAVAPSPLGSVAAKTPAAGPKKIGLGRVGLLGAAGLGAYGLMKAVPWAVRAAREEGSMPMAAGGGWSPTPYGYGYTPWGNAAPNMGAF